MIDLNSVDICCLNTSLSKSLIIILVREIDLSCVHSMIGDSFRIGLTFAIFQSVGTDCYMIEWLYILVKIGTSW